LTGLREFTKSRPAGKAVMFVLSRASDKEVIVVTADLKTVIEALPKVIVLDVVGVAV
jgi:hypothetical protein